MRTKTGAIVLAVAGVLVAASLTFLLHDWIGQAVRLSLSMLVLMLMFYPLIRNSRAEAPPVAYLWRDRRLTFPRYVLFQVAAWALFAVVFTLLWRRISV